MSSRRAKRPQRRRQPNTRGVVGRPAQIYLETKRRRRRRTGRLILLAVVLFSVGAAAWYALAESRGEATPKPPVRVLRDGRVLLSAPWARVADWPRARLRRWLEAIPKRRVRDRGAARVTFQVNHGTLTRRVELAIAAGGRDVALTERAVSATARLPVVRQALRNNCETAALSMMLALKGKRTDQLTLQRQLPRSPPIDPRIEPGGGTVWGDPRVGFVGRPEGGGPAGGYGVYERPIRALARRHGVALHDLSRRRPRSLYRSLLSGRPVMVWVGLSDGPLRRWRTPGGRQVTGNLGEHTVVLTGVSAAGVDVNDPLSGRRLRWTRGRFELMWRRLGRRALGS